MFEYRLFPEIKWAQRKDRLFVTIELADFENQKIDLTPDGSLKFQYVLFLPLYLLKYLYLVFNVFAFVNIIIFRAESHNNLYAFEIQLFDEVDVDQSKWNTKGRNIILNIAKKNTDAEHWPRLTKDKIKNSHIQIDWSKWVDEDEEDEAKPVGEDWDAENMNAFNMGGYDQGDSDDEEEEEETNTHGHVHGADCKHDHGDDHQHQ